MEVLEDYDEIIPNWNKSPNYYKLFNNAHSRYPLNDDNNSNNAVKNNHAPHSNSNFFWGNFYTFKFQTV